MILWFYEILQLTFFNSTRIFQIWTQVHTWSGLISEVSMPMADSSFSFLTLNHAYSGYILINQVYTYWLLCKLTFKEKVIYAVKKTSICCRYPEKNKSMMQMVEFLLLALTQGNPQTVKEQKFLKSINSLVCFFSSSILLPNILHWVQSITEDIFPGC